MSPRPNRVASIFVNTDTFLAPSESKGPKEVIAPLSEFSSFEAADIDVKFLIALARQHHDLSHVMCVPDHVLCLYGDSKVLFRKKTCPAAHEGRRRVYGSIRAGIIVTHVRNAGRTRVWHPPTLKSELKRCKKRFVICNFGIYLGDFGENGHANALIFDTRKHLVERFEPYGYDPRYAAVDDTMRRDLVAALGPEWRYIGAKQLRQRLQTPRTDSFKGMCVTFSLLYILTRLLNPQLSPQEIHDQLQQEEAPKLRQRILRLNRHVADTLRSFQRGTLVRRARGYKTLLREQMGSRRSGRMRPTKPSR